MTVSELDSHLRDVVLEDQLVTEEQLEEVQSILTRMHQLGLQKDLVDVLMHREYIASAKAEALRQKARFRAQLTEDRLFARMVTGSNLVDQAMIDEVSQVQEALFHAKQTIRPLAEILLARKLLSQAEHDWVCKVVTGGAGESEPEQTFEGPQPGEQQAEVPDSVQPASDSVSAAAEAAPVQLVPDSVSAPTEAAPVQPAPDSAPAPAEVAPDQPAPELVSQAEKQPDSTPNEPRKITPRSAEGPAAPASKLVAEPPVVPTRAEGPSGAQRLPPVKQRRRRKLPSMRSVMMTALVLAGIGITIGIFLMVRWLDQSRIDQQFQGAKQLIARQEFLAAEAAFRKFLADHPKSKRSADAVLELQKLLINRAEVRADSGMMEAAIERYREARLLDSTTEPAQEAARRLALLSQKLAAKKKTETWQAFVKKVRWEIQSDSLPAALKLLGQPPLSRLTAAQNNSLESLRLEVEGLLTKQLLNKFVFLPASKLQLPGLAERRSVLSRAVKRYNLRDNQAVYDGEGPGGALLVSVGQVLHAVEARTGKVLWERSLGRGRTFTPIYPQGGAGIGTGDQLPPLAVIVDPGRRSVSLIEVVSGKLRWERRLPAEISCQPVIFAPHLMVGTERGRVYQLGLDTGRVVGAFPVGGEVLASPGYEPTADLLLIPAADGFLYVYELESRRFLGRQPAPPHVGVPPLALHPFLFIPERVGNRTQLTIHKLEKKDGQLTLEQHTGYDLEGHIRTPGFALGGRIYYVTDAGVLAVYAVDPGRVSKVYPLTKSQTGRSVSNKGLLRIRPIELGRKILLAGTDLQRFELSELKPGDDQSGYNVTLDWSYESSRATGDPLHGSASQGLALAGKTAFLVTHAVETHGVNVYAFDLQRRRIVWHRTLGSGVAGRPVRLLDAGPSDGRLVVLTEDGSLHCVCLDQGAVVYRRMRRGTRHLPGGRLARIDQQSLLLARGRALMRVDSVTASAAPKFKLDFSLKSEISCGPTVSEGVAYFGTRGGSLYAVDSETGKSRHDLYTNGSGQPFSARPVVAGKMIAVGCQDHKVYGLTVKRVGQRSFLGEAWAVRTGGAIHSPLLHIGDDVVAASDDGKLYRIELTTGRVKQVLQLAAAVRGPLLSVGGRLYCGTEDFQLNRIDLEHFKLTWRVPIQGKLRTGLAADGETLYVVTTSGQARAIGQDGKTIWSVELGDRFEAGVVTVVGRHLYVPSQSGYLYEIER